MQYVEAKSAGEDQDYTIDWSEELAGAETISTSAFTTPAGLTEVADTNTTTTSTVQISGGTGGEEYEILCTITTSGSRTYEKTIIVPVTQD